MLKMVEVVGTSHDGYTDAVRRAVEQRISQGDRVHFFVVQEQRGSVRDGKLKEFQVVVKVAIED
jgi:flavin-binding protein dodecin